MAPQEQLTRRFLWGALLATQGVYVAVGLSGLVVPGSTLAQDMPILSVMLGVLSVATAIGSHALWHYLVAPAASLNRHAPRTAPLLPRMLLVWVLDESIALYGLVLALLGFPSGTWLLFSVSAIFLMLLHSPGRVSPAGPGPELGGPPEQ